MSNKSIKAINFLAQPNHESVKFFIFGDEHALCYKSKQHCLNHQNLQLLEKIYLDLDDENFVSLLDQSLMTNSLFNEKKVIFVSLSKNRLNKELISKFEKIIEYETENILIVEVLSLTKKTIEKELIDNLGGDAIFIDCFPPYESEIKKFLEANLPTYLNKKENVQLFLEMYEGFSQYERRAEHAKPRSFFRPQVGCTHAIDEFTKITSGESVLRIRLKTVAHLRDYHDRLQESAESSYAKAYHPGGNAKLDRYTSKCQVSQKQ